MYSISAIVAPITINRLSTVLNLSSTKSNSNIVLSWGPPPLTPNTLNVDYYEIFLGIPTSSSVVLGTTTSLTYTIPVTGSGIKTYSVRAVSIGLNYDQATGAVASVNTANFDRPVPPIIITANTKVVGTNIRVEWTDPNTTTTDTLPAIRYRITTNTREFSQAAIGGTNSILIPILTPGLNTIQIESYDINGVVSNSYSETSLSIIAPSTPTGFISVLQGNQYILSWIPPSIGANQVPIDYYEIGYNSNVLGKNYTTSFIADALWGGTRTFYIKAVDLVGSTAVSLTTNLSISNPPVLVPSSITSQVVDNNVLLTWQEPPLLTSNLPIASYELRKGSSWDTATPIGTKSGKFTTVFETVGGQVTYLIAAVDTAGNIGASTAINTTVNQPPDYVLKADNYTTFGISEAAINAQESGATFVLSSNMVQDTDGSRALPISPTETWAEHFTSHNWTTMQDAVNDGVTVYSAPGNLMGYYEEVIDYKTLVPTSKITITPTYTLIAGTARVTTSIAAAGTKEYTISGVTPNTFNIVASVSRTLSYSTTNTVRVLNKNKSGTYSQSGTTITVTSTNHSLTNGTTVVLDFTAGEVDNTVDDTLWVETNNSLQMYATNFRFVKYKVTVESAKSGAYSIPANSTVCTVTCASHALVQGASVLLDFLTGNAASIADNPYTVVSVIDSNNFTVALGSSISTSISSGNLYVYNSSFSGLVDISNINIKLDAKLKTTTGSIYVRPSLTGATYTQSGVDVTITTLTAHGRSAGDIVNVLMYEGTYSQAGTTITVTTSTPHSLAVGEKVILDFSSGGAKDNTYTVSSSSSTQFTVTTELVEVTSGSVKVSKGYSIKSTGSSTSISCTDTIVSSRTISGVSIDVDGSLVYLTTDKLPTGTLDFIDVEAISLTANAITATTAVYDFVDTAKPNFFRILLFDAQGLRSADATRCSYTVRGF